MMSRKLTPKAASGALLRCAHPPLPFLDSFEWIVQKEGELDDMERGLVHLLERPQHGNAHRNGDREGDGSLLSLVTFALQREGNSLIDSIEIL